MTEFWLLLDGPAAAWLDWLIGRSLAFGIAFAVIVPAVLALGRRRWLSAHAVSLAIVLPTLVLLIPLERWLPSSWPAPLPAAVGELTVRSTPTTAPDPAADEIGQRSPAGAASPVATNAATGPATDGRFADSTVASTSTVAPALRGVAMLAWLLWALAFSWHLIRRQLRVERFLLETSEPAAPAHRALLAECRRRSGIRRRVRLRRSDELPSPATAGLFRPVVFLPSDDVDDLPADQLRFVLLHELAHVRRADVLAEGLLRCLRAAFFFHPAAWLTVPLVHRWRELACDEAALARTGTAGRPSSAQALLNLADPARSFGRDHLAVAHLLNDGETMKTRIQRLLDTRRIPHTGLDARGALAATALCGLALTAARAQEAVRTEVAPTPRTATEITLDDVTPPGQAELETAIREGTRWLLSRQEDDGRFGMGPAPTDKPRDHNDAFATGLAIQALLPELDGPNGDRARTAVTRAASWLISTQDEKGHIGGDDPLTMAYGHAQALRALAMLQQRAPADELLAAIRKAVAYAEYHRNPYAGWRYQPRSGDNDAKITGLMMLALLEAQRAGAEVPQAAFEGGRMLLDELTDDVTGRTGFVDRGQPMSRFVWKNEDFPRKYSEEPTALHLLYALESGADLLETPWMQKAVGLLAATPPQWSREDGSIDYSYWQYGAEAIRHVDGFQQRLWRQRLIAELAEHRSEAGYWPAIDAWSAPGMENWTTAAALVALQSLR